jgi:hypothetical protein
MSGILSTTFYSLKAKSLVRAAKRRSKRQSVVLNSACHPDYRIEKTEKQNTLFLCGDLCYNTEKISSVPIRRKAAF